MISVLICPWNRGDLINETLRSLIESSSRSADEIVVVNGGGENDCSATLDYWKKHDYPQYSVFRRGLNIIRQALKKGICKTLESLWLVFESRLHFFSVKNIG